jgi:hypothetical protein
MQEHTDFTNAVIVEGSVAAFTKLIKCQFGTVMNIVNKCDKTVFATALDNLLKKKAAVYNDFLMFVLTNDVQLFVNINKSFDFDEFNTRSSTFAQNVFGVSGKRQTFMKIFKILDKKFLFEQTVCYVNSWLIWFIDYEHELAREIIDHYTKEQLSEFTSHSQSLLETISNDDIFGYLLDRGVCNARLNKLSSKITQRNIEKLKTLQQPATKVNTQSTSNVRAKSMSPSEIYAKLQQVLGEQYGNLVFDQIMQ